MKRCFFLLIGIALLIFVTALFLTPDFTYRCTDELFVCVEGAMNKSFFGRLGSHFVCVFNNVVCVLGGFLNVCCFS